MRRHGATPGHKLGLSVINDYEFLKLLKGQDDKYIAYSLGHGHNTSESEKPEFYLVFGSVIVDLSRGPPCDRGP